MQIKRNELIELEQENAKLKEENFKLDFKLEQIDIKKITLVENRQLAEENEKLKEKLEKIISLCQVPNEPYYNSECEFGKGRIDLGQEILEIIEGAEE